MKKLIIIGVVITILIIIFTIIWFIRLPVGSTETDYMNKRLGKNLNLSLNVNNLKRDLFGNIIAEEVSYLPEFYGNYCIARYDDLIGFLEVSTNNITFTIHSNSINLSELSKIIASLGLSYEERFSISTNVIELYLVEVSSNTFTNLVENGVLKSKDIFYKHTDKLTSAWVDISVEISKLELGISKSVDEVKKGMEDLLNKFRDDVYSYYIKQSSAKGVSKGINEFITELDREIQNLKSNLIDYQKRVDEEYSKLRILREGYKTAWDQKIEILKKNPQKYVDLFILNFPVYLLERLERYRFINVPQVLTLKNASYTLSTTNNNIEISIHGDIYTGGKFRFVGGISNGTWYGTANFEGIESKVNISSFSVDFEFEPFMDTLNGEYRYRFITDPKFNLTNLIYNFLTNKQNIKKILEEITSEEGFVTSLIDNEVERIATSYKIQFERYKENILRNINNLKSLYEKEVENSKQKLKKSIKM
ncbi:MAG: hypothetical protein N3D81_01070 [Spirochaetes bacterium]|nr:hypothetical protein [Spirochaetota bacterium]